MRIITTAVSALVFTALGTTAAVAATSTHQAVTAPVASAISAAVTGHADDRTPINFIPGAESATVPGGTAYQPRTYVFRASAGQDVFIDFASEKTSTSQQYGILTPDGEELDQVSAGQYILPEDGEYTLQTFNDTQLPFRLTLTIPAFPTHAPIDPDHDEPSSINFAPGAESATVPGGTAYQPRTYVFRASAGQDVFIDFASEKTSTSQQYGILTPDGEELDQVSAGQYILPEDGEYTLQTFNDTQLPFDLTLTIPAG